MTSACLYSSSFADRRIQHSENCIVHSLSSLSSPKVIRLSSRLLLLECKKLNPFARYTTSHVPSYSPCIDLLIRQCQQPFQPISRYNSASAMSPGSQSRTGFALKGMIQYMSSSSVRFVIVLATREGAEPAVWVPWCCVPWRSCCSLASHVRLGPETVGRIEGFGLIYCGGKASRSCM